jgi:DNA polymerase-3 subunit delta'
MSDALPAPHERCDQIGRAGLEARLRKLMDKDALDCGWIIGGPAGSGKATLAYRIVRALLAPDALLDETTLQVPAESSIARLVAEKAHPDFFIVERQWNDKTSKYSSEISVETIRELTLFLNHTPAMGGYRAAIIDKADDLNHHGANALLKSLEEPHKKTLLLLISDAPARLLATIRSRCRRIDLRPLEQDEIAAFLAREGGVEAGQGEKIAAASGGRPGYALSLAKGEGAAAAVLAESYLSMIAGGASPGPVASALSGKADDEQWRIFRQIVLDRLCAAARMAARGACPPAPLASYAPEALLAGWERASSLAARSERLNLDRGQLIAAMAYDLREALTGA